MATTRRTQELDVDADRLWAVVRDPHHLPRWWPRVDRVENVTKDRWTTVTRTRRGHTVRADFRLEHTHARRERRWSQVVEGTPFERVLQEEETAVRLEPEGDERTRVTVEIRRRPRGFARLGVLQLRRAARRTADEALRGLAEVA